MIALPIDTPRLRVRLFTPADASALAAYRSDPEVARYQSWDVPYSVEDAAAMLAEQAALIGPTAGQWVQLAVEHDGAVVGDVAVHLDARGAIAEIGYSLATEQQGRGLATEAVAAVVDALLASGVHRIEAGVDPRNLASRRVLERVGFVREGVARQAFASGDAWLDDERWSLLADDREAVTDVHAPGAISLVELDHANVRAYGQLATHPSQERLVAPMWASFADALRPSSDEAGAPLAPWLRGIEADGAPVGFIMVAAPTPTSPDPYLWRLLVDRRWQRHGIGREAMAALVDHWRAAGTARLLVSWVPGPGSPEPFYLRLGFVPTGRVVDGEVEAALTL